MRRGRKEGREVENEQVSSRVTEHAGRALLSLEILHEAFLFPFAKSYLLEEMKFTLSGPREILQTGLVINLNKYHSIPMCKIRACNDNLFIHCKNFSFSSDFVGKSCSSFLGLLNRGRWRYCRIPTCYYY
jgi:hypothetical protein